METSLSFFGDGRCFVSTDEPALVRRCYAGIENHRDEVEIIAEPPENDGVLYFSCPVSFGRRAVRALFGPKQSAEQKAAAAARLRDIQQRQRVQAVAASAGSTEQD